MAKKTTAAPAAPAARPRTRAAQPSVSASAPRVAPRPAPRPAPVAADDGVGEDGFQEFPKVKYQKCDVAPRTPNGYRWQRVQDADEEAQLDASWKDTPADL